MNNKNPVPPKKKIKTKRNLVKFRKLFTFRKSVSYRIILVVAVFSILGTVAIASTFSYFYKQIQTTFTLQSASITALEQQNKELQTQLSATSASLTEQIQRYNYLADFQKIQQSSIDKIELSLDLMNGDQLAFLRLINLLERANTLWQRNFSKTQVLPLLKTSYDIAKKLHLLDTRNKFAISLLRDIQALEMLHPVDKLTTMQSIKSLNQKLQKTLTQTAQNQLINTTTTATNTQQTTSATVSFSAKFLTAMQKVFVIRDREINDEWWQEPKTLFLFRQTVYAKFSQVESALLHNNFYYARLILSQLNDNLDHYSGLSPLKKQLISIIGLVSKLQIRSNLTLYSFDEIQTMTKAAAKFNPIDTDAQITKPANNP